MPNSCTNFGRDAFLEGEFLMFTSLLGCIALVMCDLILDTGLTLKFLSPIMKNALKSCCDTPSWKWQQRQHVYSFPAVFFFFPLTVSENSSPSTQIPVSAALLRSGLSAPTGLSAARCWTSSFLLFLAAFCLCEMQMKWKNEDKIVL